MSPLNVDCSLFKISGKSLLKVSMNGMLKGKNKTNFNFDDIANVNYYNKAYKHLEIYSCSN